LIPRNSNYSIHLELKNLFPYNDFLCLRDLRQDK
jgi:hypothetical protein